MGRPILKSAMFRFRQPLSDPHVIVKINGPREIEFVQKRIDGFFYRVFPKNYREVCYIQTLSVGYNVYAPAEGDGVIVKASCLPPSQ